MQHAERPPARGSANSAASPNPDSLFGKDRVVARAPTLGCYGRSALAPIHFGTTFPSRVPVFQKQKGSAAARLVGQSAIILRTLRLCQWRIGLKHQPVPLGTAGTWTKSLCAVMVQGSVCFNLTPFVFCVSSVSDGLLTFPCLGGPAKSFVARRWTLVNRTCLNGWAPAFPLFDSLEAWSLEQEIEPPQKNRRFFFPLSRSWRHSASGPRPCRSRTHWPSARPVWGKDPSQSV